MSATVDQLQALPEGAVVLSGGFVWVKDGGKWLCHEKSLSRLSVHMWETANSDGIQILYPLPEPDHSMCARLAWDGDSWTLRHPNGGHGLSFSADQARDRGYPIPDDRTVEERARDAMDELWAGVSPDADSGEIVARLAELGLLAEDEEGEA